MGHYLERIRETDQWQEIQAGDILDAILVGNALAEFFVGADGVSESLDSGDEIRMRLTEVFPALFVAGVKQGAVRENHPCRNHLLVAVGMGPAAHPGSVVYHDSADHRAFHGSGIRAQLIMVRSKNLVNSPTSKAGLDADKLPALRDRIFFPMLPRHYKDTVADCLARKACPGGAEGHRQGKL